VVYNSTSLQLVMASASAGVDGPSSNMPLVPAALVFGGQTVVGGRSTVSLGLPYSSRVQLDLFDLGGRRIARLEDGDLAAGWHQYAIGENRALGSGIYFARLSLEHGGVRETKTARILVIK